MSVAWRFDLIPDISPPSGFTPTLMGTRQSTPATLLIVSVTSDIVKEGSFNLQIWELVDESPTTVYSQTGTLSEGESDFVVTQLRRGTYSGMAFVDVNQDGEMNFDKNGTPKEPFGLLHIKKGGPSQGMADTVFDLGQDPVFVKIHISNTGR